MKLLENESVIYNLSWMVILGTNIALNFVWFFVYFVISCLKTTGSTIQYIFKIFPSSPLSFYPSRITEQIIIKRNKIVSLFLLRVFWCPLTWNQIGVIIFFDLLFRPLVYFFSQSIFRIYIPRLSLCMVIIISNLVCWNGHFLFYIFLTYRPSLEYELTTLNQVFFLSCFPSNTSIDHSLFFVSTAKINWCNDLMIILFS